MVINNSYLKENNMKDRKLIRTKLVLAIVFVIIIIIAIIAIVYMKKSNNSIRNEDLLYSTTYYFAFRK